MMIWPFKRKPDPRVFTGNCMVHQYTMDRRYAGRCYHSTYDYECHLHGNVAIYLEGDANWPADFDLEPDRGER